VVVQEETSLTMTPFIAIFLMRGSPLTRFEITVILLFAGAVMLVGICCSS
jgi:hypothetical protein